MDAYAKFSSTPTSVSFKEIEVLLYNLSTGAERRPEILYWWFSQTLKEETIEEKPKFLQKYILKNKMKQVWFVAKAKAFAGRNFRSTYAMNNRIQQSIKRAYIR